MNFANDPRMFCVCLHIYFLTTHFTGPYWYCK